MFFIFLSFFACNNPIEETGVVKEKPDQTTTEVSSLNEPSGETRVLAYAVPPQVIIPSGKPIIRECYGSRSENRTMGARGSGSATRSTPKPDSSPKSLERKKEANLAMSPPPSMQEEAGVTEMEAPVETVVDIVDDKMDADGSEDRTVAQKDMGPQVEWGGTIYLSNDDSMSLASAQRLLWAVKNNKPFTTSQVRPHELLNYFSFDTNQVDPADVFSLHASAEQVDNDSLAIALAVKGATPPRLPLDLTLVIDRSGSMSSEGRMEYVKRGLSLMSQNLVEGDRIDIVLFDTDVCTPLENYVVGRDDSSILTSTINEMQPRGSTNMDAGLKEGYRVATSRVTTDVQDRNRRVILLTDAFLNTGSINHDVVSEIGKAFEEHNIRLSGIGVGTDFNDDVLDKLTEKGKGAYVYLGSEAVVDRVFGVGFESLTRTIAHDVKFSLTLPDSLAMERFYGEESSRNPEAIQPINYYSSTSQLFLQDVKIGNNGKLKGEDEIKFDVKWKDPATNTEKSQTFTKSIGELVDQDPHNVRKARTLMAWTDLLLAKPMGGDPCGDPLTKYTGLANSVSDDAEIVYVNSLVQKMCKVDLPTTPVPVLAGVTYKIKLDADLPIAEVALQCSGNRLSQKLTMGESVAVFNTMPGSCTLYLEGNVSMQTQVTVPQTGGDLKCTVRGGRVSCS